MYKCEYFKIYELVPKAYYEGYPEYKLWWLFDDRALMTLDLLRKQYGKIVANDWYFGGIYQERGIRPEDSITGALFSQHKYGRAFDLKFKDIPVGVVRQDCIAKRYDCFKYITAIEIEVSWFHFDTRNNTGDLITFKK
jgi:hypothetical protein